MGQMKKAKGNNSFPPPFPPVRKIKNADGTYTNVTSNDLAGMTSAKRIPKSPGALRTVRGRTAQRGIDQAKRQGVKSAKRAGKK